MTASYAIITCADNLVTTVTCATHLDPAQNGSTGNAKI